MDKTPRRMKHLSSDPMVLTQKGSRPSLAAKRHLVASAAASSCLSFDQDHTSSDGAKNCVFSKLAGPFLPRCWTSVKFSVLLEICRLFWNLSKPAQDTVLWSMQTGGATLGNENGSSSSSDSSDSSTPGPYMKWFLAGTQVCRRAFQRMLGIGNARLSRTRARFQGLDERNLKGQGTRAATASASVHTFMQRMYYSISESMPTGFLGHDILKKEFCISTPIIPCFSENCEK